MPPPDSIPVFSLFGETDPFPDVVHCERFSARAPDHDWHISTHRHARIAQLFIVFEGTADFKVDAERYTLKDGLFLFIPAQLAHEVNFQPGPDGFVLSFPSSVLSTIAPKPQEVLSALARPVLGPVSETLRTLATTLVHAQKMPGAYRAQFSLGLAHSVLSLVAEEGQKSGPQTPASLRLEILDDLIAKRMRDGWSASDYAKALNMSTGHLSRLCRQKTGLGTAAYVENRIMEEACRLLAFTRLPVSDIGYRLGYEDPSYFSKRFRLARGQTPSQYRAQF